MIVREAISFEGQGELVMATNVLLKSATLSTLAWNARPSSVTQVSTPLAPDGSSQPFRLTYNSVSDQLLQVATPAISPFKPNTIWCFSMFVYGYSTGTSALNGRYRDSSGHTTTQLTCSIVDTNNTSFTQGGNSTPNGIGFQNANLFYNLPHPDTNWTRVWFAYTQGINVPVAHYVADYWFTIAPNSYPDSIIMWGPQLENVTNNPNFAPTQYVAT
jgi:hypothetical protein